MNILSTPIARIKNGTTYVEISEREYPAYSKIPIDTRSELITIRIPPSPRRKRWCTKEGKKPSDIEI